MTGSSMVAGRLVVAVFGSATDTPWWSIGAVTMKMMRRTSMTSTSGVTLMSARWSKGSPLCLWNAMERLGEIPLRQVDELEREVLHSGALLADLSHEVVVEDERRNRSGETGGRVDEGLRDSGCDRRDRRRAGRADRAERLHDPPHGPEE